MSSRILAFVAIVIAPVIVAAQPLAERVPADAMVYVGWRGSADPGQGYAQSNLKAVLEDSNVPEFIDKFLPEVIEKVGQMNPDAAQFGQILSAIAKPSWQHPTAFFFAGVDLANKDNPVPHLGIIWQPGADAEALARQLNQLVDKAAGAPFPVKVIQQDSIVALVVGYTNADAAIAGRVTKSLADDQAFKAANSHLSVKDPVAAAYIDYEHLLGIVDDLARAAGDRDAQTIWPKVRDDLGLRGVKHLAAASGFEGRDYGSEIFLDSPDPREGIFKLSSGKPLDEEILAAIPRTITTAGAGRFDVAGLYDLIRRTVADADPGAAREFDQFFDHISTDSGVDVRKDLLESLGDEWAYFADPTIGGRGLASLTMVNHLKDPAKFEQSLAKIEDFALREVQRQAGAAGADVPVRIAFETTRIDELTIHYLAVPLVAPAWAVRGGNLYLSLFPQVTAEAARRVTNHRGSIMENEAFRAICARLGQQNPASFSFADLPQTAPDAYGSWLVVSRLVGFADLFGIKSPPLLMPALPKLMVRLSPAGSVGWQDADGFHQKMIEPFPGSTIVASDPMTSAIYAEPVLISILLPALNRAREQANRVKSASNLRQIGQAAMMYANENRGQFPPDLGTMMKKEDLNAGVFVNPRSNTAGPPGGTPDQLAEWVAEHSDYVWLGKGKNVSKVTPETILAYEKLEDNIEGVNILFGDGHVEWEVMPAAQQMIEKAKAGGKIDANP